MKKMVKASTYTMEEIINSDVFDIVHSRTDDIQNKLDLISSYIYNEYMDNAEYTFNALQADITIIKNYLDRIQSGVFQIIEENGGNPKLY